MVEKIKESLVGLADQLDQAAARLDFAPLDRLTAAAGEVGKAWSGSWLGYHSRVYYRDLQPVPPGAHFSVEWGRDNAFGQGTVGDWVEFEFESVVKTIAARAGGDTLDEYTALSTEVGEELEETRAAVLSMLSTALKEIGDDGFISDIIKSVKEVKLLSALAIVDHLSPSQVSTRDMAAAEGGRKTPPHVWVIARATAIRSPFTCCATLSKLARRAAAHLGVARRQPVSELASGTKIFIGHGRSPVWKDLKDFFQDRLGLPWDEFNRVPVAGVTNAFRLKGMLDDAIIAFIIMTAEDEAAEGGLRARMNVIHEVGLFQGRLGFERAIVLLEDGCEEFSNIHGLGQVRFPSGNIAAIFEEIRRVLEREGVVESESRR